MFRNNVNEYYFENRPKQTHLYITHHPNITLKTNITFITPAYNDRVPRARARQPRFGSSMQYCIRSLISITNVQKYCKRAKVCASLLLWHFKTIWIENICLPFIEVHCSNQQKPVSAKYVGQPDISRCSSPVSDGRLKNACPNVRPNFQTFINNLTDTNIRKYSSTNHVRPVYSNKMRTQ